MKKSRILNIRLAVCVFVLLCSSPAEARLESLQPGAISDTEYIEEAVLEEYEIYAKRWRLNVAWNENDHNATYKLSLPPGLTLCFATIQKISAAGRYDIGFVGQGEQPISSPSTLIYQVFVGPRGAWYDQLNFWIDYQVNMIGVPTSSWSPVKREYCRTMRERHFIRFRSPVSSVGYGNTADVLLKKVP